MHKNRFSAVKPSCVLAMGVFLLAGCGGGGAGSSTASASAPVGSSGPSTGVSRTGSTDGTGSSGGTPAGGGSTPPVTPTPTTGSATVSWSAPTTNTDGSALTDLAGYHIYYGTSATSLTQSVNITSSAIASYVLQNLASGTWYFAVTAVTNAGAESARSSVVSKTVT